MWLDKATAKKPVGRPPKRTFTAEEKPKAEAAQSPWWFPWNIPFLTQAELLTKKEIDSWMRSMLIECFTTVAEQADNFVSHTNKRHETAFIWQTIESDQWGIIADAILEQAQKHKPVAAIVRTTLGLYKAGQIPYIIAPCVWMTVTFYQANGGFSW